MVTIIPTINALNGIFHNTFFGSSISITFNPLIIAKIKGIIKIIAHPKLQRIPHDLLKINPSLSLRIPTLGRDLYENILALRPKKANPGVRF